ncbi:MAG: 2-C-methyl-D-erythritol 2,4-cyclodiphosphate synthase [Clostridia bacterium]
MQNLSNINVLITAGGQSQRYGSENKLFEPCGVSCVLIEAIKPFLCFNEIAKVIVAIDPSYSDELLNMLSVELIEDNRITLTIGGKTRTETVKNGLKALSDDCDLVLIHDGARPYVTEKLIASVITATKTYGAAFPAIEITDSVIKTSATSKLQNFASVNTSISSVNAPNSADNASLQSASVTIPLAMSNNAKKANSSVDTLASADNANIATETVDSIDGSCEIIQSDDFPKPVLRDNFRRVQTPFGCLRADIVNAYARVKDTKTDDYSVLYEAGGKAVFVAGDKKNIKITTKADLATPLVGCGYDIHRLQKGSGIKLNGVYIPCPFSFVAHSDGDVPVHAIMDAILSALGERDIGHFFPVNDPKYDNIDSFKLLSVVLDIMRKKSCKIVNMAVTIIAEKPMIAPLIDQMRANLSKILDIPANRVGITATSNEQVGTIGDGNAIAAYATVLLKNIDN